MQLICPSMTYVTGFKSVLVVFRPNMVAKSLKMAANTERNIQIAERVLLLLF